MDRRATSALDRLSPRNWSDAVWIVAALVALPLGYDNAVAGYSAATGLALLCGSVQGWRRALRLQAIVALVTVPTALLLGTPAFELGYVVGRPLAAVAAAFLTPSGKPLQRAREAAVLLLAMAATAIPVAVRWREPWAALGLRNYYAAVLFMAGVLAIYYSVRLVAYPARVLGLAAALAPYYLVGIVWAFAVPMIGGAAPGDRMISGDLVFHGFVAHLPADLLTAVVVGFVSGPKGGLRI